MDSTALTKIAFYVFFAAGVIFLVEALYLAVVTPILRKRAVNRRMKMRDESGSGEASLIQMKLERGITGSNAERSGYLAKLLVQSGLRISSSKFILMTASLFVAIMVSLKLLTLLPIYFIIGFALLLGVLLPLQIVKFIRSRRIAKFTLQLPDALELIVRSLRSGHPVSVALSLVGKEMSDPVGTEFGITIDEMTYGLDMPRALRNLNDRVGLPDLALLVTAVSLQSTSGGNLAEVLGNLSRVLRERFQLRRKVRSLSAEGRMSAYGLAILPILIAGAIYSQNKGFYMDVWDDPFFLPGMAALLVWSLIGDLIMFKMINFKY
jgi:tight adherence protein B